MRHLLPVCELSHAAKGAVTLSHNGHAAGEILRVGAVQLVHVPLQVDAPPKLTAARVDGANEGPTVRPDVRLRTW